ncbi:ATP-binding domain-containing protein [Sandaracinus amylolyticus]|uniref:ATP-binding domain-containing protein n=1 Tax=Sandaracinus amylolyticus TaxID=927083 RepID=UPI001F1C990F|nr:ATP-binding domain-containing protein [Sandaracinus amylolyticus]UJR81129.1 DNA helicase [Sandaracinus amylolyticus]
MDALMTDAVVAEEEALLTRVRAALQRAEHARATHDGLRDAGELRALREEAQQSADDDLPALLHEMTVRQRLRERQEPSALPDPDHPYVAHLRVEDERGVRDYVLGHASYVDPRSDVRVVDWRTAPIAQVFYRYREGDEYEEEIAGRLVTGMVLARRVVVIERGELTRILGDGIALSRGDGGWQDDHEIGLAGGGAGVAARKGSLGIGVGAEGRAARADVTALLDAEQHAAIAAPPSKPLLVIGSAGSGKTTVALHRLARVTAREPSRYPVDRVRVIVPEEGLARLSRRLLEPLGVQGAQQVSTLDHWALTLAKETFGGVPRIGQETPAIVVRLKRHPALFDALRARCASLAPERTRNVRKLQRALAPIMSDYEILGRVVEASKGDLPKSAIEETVRHTMRQLSDSPEKELASITDAAAKTTIDGRQVWEDTPEATAGSIDLEDLPIYLWLRAWRGGIGSARIAHLVLDEAEDFSLFELSVLRALVQQPPSVTLAGDDAQQTGTGFAGWSRSLDALGAKGASQVKLSISYRCPRPVAQLARTILGEQAPEEAVRAAREGVPVVRDAFPDEAHAQLVMASAVRDLAEREPRASIAIIASDEDAARRAHDALSDTPRVRLVLEGDFTFEPGIDVTHVDAVKGLEFDYVVLPDVSARTYPDDRESRRRLHVAVTRTTYQLWIIEPGARSPIL